MVQKQPLITSADDTKTKLADVLNPNGVLRLTGSNLNFEEDDPDCGCTITGTESGETRQSTFAMISNAEILLVPDIPAQAHPWNNEYTVTVTTQYTEHGTERSGTYQRRLRTPLAVPGLGLEVPPETGILTDNAAMPYVNISGGMLTADERLRIQVTLNLHEGTLSFNLLDMKEDGEAGTPVSVTADDDYTLPGFSGSALTSLDLTVNNFADLMQMIQNHYAGRLLDVLELAV